MRLLLLFSLLLTVSGSAEETSVIFQKRRPLQVTGQLAPFRFLVNEVLLFERPQSYTSLKVNGIKVRLKPPAPEQNSRLFQFDTDAEMLNIDLSAWNGEKDNFRLRPPKVKSAKWKNEKFTFILEHNSPYATIDENRVTVEDDKIEWGPGKKSHDPHVLVLRGEGNLPDTIVEFQLVNKTEFKELTLQKKREDKKNKNRLVASVKENWLDKVEWSHAEFDLGLRLGAGSGFTLGAALAPHYAYSRTWGVRVLLGLNLFTGGGMELGARAGFHVTYGLSLAPITVEIGPAFSLTRAAGFATGLDFVGLYEMAGIPLLSAVGVNYTFWLTPGVYFIRLVAQIKF